MTRDELLSKLGRIEGRRVNVFVGDVVTIGKLKKVKAGDGKYRVGGSSLISASDVERVRIDKGRGYAQISAQRIYNSNGRGR